MRKAEFFGHVGGIQGSRLSEKRKACSRKLLKLAPKNEPARFLYIMTFSVALVGFLTETASPCYKILEKARFSMQMKYGLTLILSDQINRCGSRQTYTLVLAKKVRIVSSIFDAATWEMPEKH